MRVSQLIVDLPEIAELDLNPLIVDTGGVRRSCRADTDAARRLGIQVDSHRHSHRALLRVHASTALAVRARPRWGGGWDPAEAPAACTTGSHCPSWKAMPRGDPLLSARRSFFAVWVPDAFSKIATYIAIVRHRVAPAPTPGWRMALGPSRVSKRQSSMPAGAAGCYYASKVAGARRWPTTRELSRASRGPHQALPARG